METSDASVKTIRAVKTIKEHDVGVADVVHVLAPFKVAQESFEGEIYVNFSIFPLLSINSEGPYMII